MELLREILVGGDGLPPGVRLQLSGTADKLTETFDAMVLDIMMPGGGYAASPSHDYVLPETPVENVLAVYEVIGEYGGYN